MPPTIIPVVLAWGTPKYPRYVIIDTSGRFWTGSGWAEQERHALLYACHNDASADAHRILWRQFRRHTVYQQFVVPLELQIFTNVEASAEELKAFARKCFKMSALYANHGTGPTPDSLVLPRLNWGRMTQPINSERDLHVDE